MGITTRSVALSLFAASGLAQNVTVSDVCTDTYQTGTDVVMFSLPYTYDQVKSVIGSFGNLSYFGVPSVQLNGSDNTVGTSRTYTLGGATIVETENYVDDAAYPGPWQEFHNFAVANFSEANTSLYMPYDGVLIEPACAGKASKVRFYSQFCATNVEAAQELIHSVHANSAATISQMLGGQNFTSCAALGVYSNSTSTSNATAPHPTGTGSPVAVNGTSVAAPSTSATIAPYTGTGAASKFTAGASLSVVAAIAAALAWL